MDTFWCFTNLMGEIRDNFIKHMDNTTYGIGMLRLYSSVEVGIYANSSQSLVA